MGQDKSCGTSRTRTCDAGVFLRFACAGQAQHALFFENVPLCSLHDPGDCRDAEYSILIGNVDEAQLKKAGYLGPWAELRVAAALTLYHNTLRGRRGLPGAGSRGPLHAPPERLTPSLAALYSPRPQGLAAGVLSDAHGVDYPALQAWRSEESLFELLVPVSLPDHHEHLAELPHPLPDAQDPGQCPPRRAWSSGRHARLPAVLAGLAQEALRGALLVPPKLRPQGGRLGPFA